MKRFFALMLALCLLTAMIPVGAAAQVGELAVLDRVDPGMQISVEALRQEAILLEQEQQRLELYISELGTVQGILRIAQERLGLVEPGSVIIQPE